MAASDQDRLSQILPALLLENISISIAYIVAFVLFMRWSSRHQPDTDFTAFQCIAAIGITTQLTGLFGYSLAFAFVAIAGLLIASFLRAALAESTGQRLLVTPKAAASGK